VHQRSNVISPSKIMILLNPSVCAHCVDNARFLVARHRNFYM